MMYESLTVLASSLILSQVAWEYFYSTFQRSLVIPLICVPDFIDIDFRSRGSAHFGYVAQLADSAWSSNPAPTPLPSLLWSRYCAQRESVL
jgi:hypothetical protein